MTVQRARSLITGSAPVLDGLCRVAADLTLSDAAGISFLTEKEQIFYGREGICVTSVRRCFPFSVLEKPISAISDVRPMVEGKSCDLVHGAVDRFVGMLVTPLQFDGVAIGVFACYSRRVRDDFTDTAKARLLDLRAAAEAYISYETSLTKIVRTSMAAIERGRAIEEG